MLSLAADVNVSSTNNTPSPLRISNSTHKVIKVTTTPRTNRGTDTDKGKGKDRDRDSMDNTAVVQLGVDTIHHRKDPHRLRKETPGTMHLALATSLVALYLYVYFLPRI